MSGRGSDVVKHSGKRFGRLLVLNLYEKRGRRIYWLCRCDCGREVFIRAYGLTSGHAISCGCYNKQRVSETRSADLKGKRFGRLVVGERIKEKDIAGGYYWNAQCDCGNKIKTTSNSLLSGNSSSCGCLRLENAAKACTKHGLSKTKEYKQACVQRRLEKKKELDSEWTAQMQLELNTIFDYCVICGAKDNLETDHVFPLYFGNGLRPGNAVRLCSHHNAVKGCRPLDFMGAHDKKLILDAAEEFRTHWNEIKGDNYESIYTTVI